MPDPAVFLRDVWERRPLLTRAGDLPSPYDDLLSMADVDELVAERGLREPFFRLVRGGEDAARSTRTVSAGNRRIADVADPDRVREEYAAGATLVLQALHRLHPPVVRFCRALAAELGHPTQCNAYVTPGGGAQGFRWHHDTHDVLVLQVAGSKGWRVHTPQVELPLPSQPRAGDDLVAPDAEPVLDVTLRAGDALYLPRGWIHAARTTDEPSVHLTVGVLCLTWYDVLQAAVGLAADELPLRRAVPPAGGAPAGMGDTGVSDGELLTFARDASAWLAGLPADRLRGLLDDRLAKAVPPEPLGMIAQAETARLLTGSTRLRPRKGLRATVTEAPDGRVLLRVRDREVGMPGFCAEALRRALAGPATPADLAEADTSGEIAVADALVLTRRLLREGVLTADS